MKFLSIFIITFFFLKFPGKKLESSSVVLVFYHMSYMICQTSSATRTLESSSLTTKKTSRVLFPRNCPSPPPTSCGKSLENRPFPSFPGPLYQNEVYCSGFDMKMIFHSHANKLIFTRKVVHLASFWKWGFLELRSGLLESGVKQSWQFNFNFYKDHPPPPPGGKEGGKGMDMFLTNNTVSTALKTSKL